MHEVLVNRLGGLSLLRSVVRLTDRPDMTLDVYRGCKTTMQQCINHKKSKCMTPKIIHFYSFPTNRTAPFYNAVMHPKDVDNMANSVRLITLLLWQQDDLGLYCLSWP